jgi:glutathione peroxidase
MLTSAGTETSDFSATSAGTATSTTGDIRSETLLQRMMRLIYPLVLMVNRFGKHGTPRRNQGMVGPRASFYALTAELNTGEHIDFSGFRGRKVILVNTASDCGFTGQYAELQALYEQFAGRVHIVAFPANDFANQESGNDGKIAQFCQRNYGVTFPVTKKSMVVKDGGDDAVSLSGGHAEKLSGGHTVKLSGGHTVKLSGDDAIKTSSQYPVYQWLTHKALNGWNDHPPDWNFAKYVINEEGVLTHYFGPAISPLSPEFLVALD